MYCLRKRKGKRYFRAVSFFHHIFYGKQVLKNIIVEKVCKFCPCLKLKSSLDTILRTASELITGIEGQLQEIQRDREMMQEQEKEGLLLVQDSALSEYSLLSVRGMDAAEIANEETELVFYPPEKSSL